MHKSSECFKGIDIGCQAVLGTHVVNVGSVLGVKVVAGVERGVALAGGLLAAVVCTCGGCSLITCRLARLFLPG